MEAPLRQALSAHPFRARVAYLFLLTYKLVLAPIFQILGGSPGPSCRYSQQSCSSFMFAAISYKGFFKGSILALLRILSCNPWMKPHPSLEQINSEDRKA